MCFGLQDEISEERKQILDFVNKPEPKSSIDYPAALCGLCISRHGNYERELKPAEGKQEGMGLGFFIAKTLIEQTGGAVSARNRVGGGAMVTLRWARGTIDGETPPRQEPEA